MQEFNDDFYVQGREAERNMKKLQLDESAFINDFRAAVSKLDSHEQVHLVRCALNALELDNGVHQLGDDDEKIDNDEKSHLVMQKLTVKDSANINGVHNNEINLREIIKKLQDENTNLTANIEELDQQQAQSLGN